MYTHQTTQPPESSIASRAWAYEAYELLKASCHHPRVIETTYVYCGPTTAPSTYRLCTRCGTLELRFACPSAPYLHLLLTDARIVSAARFDHVARMLEQSFAILLPRGIL